MSIEDEFKRVHVTPRRITDPIMRIVGKAEKSQKVVWLDCEAEDSCGRWVIHRFSRDRDLDDGSKPKKGGFGIESLFKCDKCGHERRFGLR